MFVSQCQFVWSVTWLPSVKHLTPWLGTPSKLEFLEDSLIQLMTLPLRSGSGVQSSCQQLNTQCPVWLLGTVPASEGTFQRDLSRGLYCWRTRQSKWLCLELFTSLVFPERKGWLVPHELLLRTYIHELVALLTRLRLWRDPVWTMTPLCEPLLGWADFPHLTVNFSSIGSPKIRVVEMSN